MSRLTTLGFFEILYRWQLFAFCPTSCKRIAIAEEIFTPCNLDVTPSHSKRCSPFKSSPAERALKALFQLAREQEIYHLNHVSLFVSATHVLSDDDSKGTFKILMALVDV
jgi:hypothetical protein